MDGTRTRDHQADVPLGALCEVDLPSALGFVVWGVGCGCRVSGVGCGVWGVRLGCGVEVLGFRFFLLACGV